MSSSSNDTLQNALRRLPAVDEAISTDLARRAADGLEPAVVRRLAREVIETRREELRAAFSGPSPRAEAATGDEHSLIAGRLAERMSAIRSARLVRAINATGVIIHTGMGRSPLAAEALEAVSTIGRGYCDVAISRDHGGRRNRVEAVEELLQILTGCESALVVNNNAAATVLALATHARGREVIVSRGQLVEIGGSFRLPDVMRSAGVVLKEVGTTNRTRLGDYEEAIDDSTAALMRIHPSNFRIVGFTESVEIRELVALGRKRGLLVMDDLGSGALLDLRPYGLAGEPFVHDSVDSGANIVLFSGDKLLGGPQAGILVGRKEAIAACARNPLMRALRVDRMTLAALAATLRLYLEPKTLERRLPVLRMIAEDEAAVRKRAGRVVSALRRLVPDVRVVIERDGAFVGGGSLPEQSLPSWIVALPEPPGGSEPVKRRLRLGPTPVFARARSGRIEFDMRTVADEEILALTEAIQAAVQSPGD